MKTTEEIEELVVQTELYKENSHSTIIQKAIIWGFRDGYNKCEKDNSHKQFSLHDLMKAIEFAREGNIGYHAPDSPAFYFDKTEDEIIQSVKTNK